MTIVVDSQIPFFVETIHDGWPQVTVLPLRGEDITAAAVRDADVLVVRTRTRVDEALLRDSNVRMVCTATIGFDHIDTAYCESHGIRWMSCPGCNARAVCDYIEEALNEYHTAQRSNSETVLQPKAVLQRSGLVIGIVGVGHVGSLVAQMAEKRGMSVLLNDPPKRIGVALEEIAKQCDIITFHVPLDESTYHLCDASFLAQCKPGALIINAARGGVVDEQALLRSGHPFILDTWENEPHINTAVLDKALLASMHIAGYSVEGKKNATQACLDAISEEFCLPILKCEKKAVPLCRIFNREPCAREKHRSLAISGDNAPGWLMRVSEQLKAAPQDFEQLRKQYKLR